MKKIFSAFLLMTMMVASVGSFVSCSDIEESIAAVDEATKNNADAVEALKSEVAALKTALATAQADAAAAKAEANAAKQAAATAKAEAIAAALAEIEKVNGDVDAMQAVIDSINAALTGKADKATVELLQATLDEYKALNDAAVSENAKAIAALEEALAALGENVDPEQFAEVVAKMEAIDAALIAFQSRIQSVAYVAQSMTAPEATQFTVGKEETDYIIQLAYQVSPVSAAAELENAEVYFKGIAVKAEAPVKFETKVVSVDEATGMVEAVAYIPEEVVEEAEAEGVVIALAIENENGVEITSTYEKFATASATLANYVALKDFDANNTYTYEMPYDTAIADSKVDMINPEFVVNVTGMFEETPLAEVLEYLGLEDVAVERNPENRFGTKYIKIENNSLYDNNATPTNATTDDLKVLKDTQSADKKDVTVEFSEDYAKVADATKLIGKNVVVTLSEGFFTIAGDKLPKATIKYAVVAKENKVAIEIDDVDSPWIPVTEFNDVAYDGIAQKNFPAQTVAIVDADGEKVKGSDNKDVTVTITPKSHDDLTVKFSSNFVWPEETTTYTVAGEFNGELDEDTATQTVYTYEFTVTVEGRPEDVEVETTPSPLPVLTLTAAPNVNDPADLDDKDPEEDLASSVEVGTIATVLSKDYAAYYEENELVGKIGAALEAAEWKVYVLDVDTDEVASTPISLNEDPYFTYVAATATAVEKSKVTFIYDVEDYEALTEAEYIQIATTVVLNGVTYEIRSNAKVAAWTVPAVPGAGLTMGKFNPSTLKGTNPFTWATKNAYWTEYGKDTTTSDDEVYHNYNYVEVNSTGSNYTFGGESLNLADYVKITGVAEAELKNYYVRIAMTDAPTYSEKMTNAKGEKVDSTMFYYYEYANDTKTAETAIPTIKNGYLSASAQPLFKSEAVAKADTVHVKMTGVTGKVVLPAVAAAKAGEKNTAVFTMPATKFANTVISWNNSKVNKFTLKVELVKYNISADTDNLKAEAADYAKRLPAVATYNAVFETPKAISNFEVVNTAEAYEFKHGETLNIQIDDHIQVTDLFDKPVNNTYGTLANIWDGYTWEAAPNTESDPALTAETYGNYVVSAANFFKVYGQEISFDYLVDAKGVAKTVKIENNNDLKLDPATTPVYDTNNKLTVADGYDYAFDPATGTIAINSKLANISRETTITVRVKFTHMHDGFEPIYKNVNVKVVNAQ